MRVTCFSFNLQLLSVNNNIATGSSVGQIGQFQPAGNCNHSDKVTVKEKIQARLREKGAHFSVPKRKQPEPHKPVGTIFRLTSKCIFVFCCKWEIRFSLSFVVKIIAIRQNWNVLVSTSGLYTIISVFNYILTTAIASFSRIYVYQLKNFRFAFQILGKPFSRYLILTEGESEGNVLLKYSNRGTKLFPGNEVLYWKNFFFVSIDFANAEVRSCQFSWNLRPWVFIPHFQVL